MLSSSLLVLGIPPPLPSLMRARRLSIIICSAEEDADDETTDTISDAIADAMADEEDTDAGGSMVWTLLLLLLPVLPTLPLPVGGVMVCYPRGYLSLETQEFCLRESKKCAAVGRRMDGLAGARIRIG